MFIVLIVIAAISIILALWSLKKQSQLEEVAKVKKQLQKSRVIYHKDSSK